MSDVLGTSTHARSHSMNQKMFYTISLSLSLSIYIYIHLSLSLSLYIYIYIYCHEQEIDSQQCPYAARAEQKKSSSHSRNGNGRLSTVFYRCLEVRISTFPTHLTSLSGGGFAKLMPRAARAMFLLTKLAFAQWVTLKMHERVAKFRGHRFKV